MQQPTPSSCSSELRIVLIVRTPDNFPHHHHRNQSRTNRNIFSRDVSDVNDDSQRSGLTHSLSLSHLPRRVHQSCGFLTHGERKKIHKTHAQFSRALARNAQDPMTTPSPQCSTSPEFRCHSIWTRARSFITACTHRTETPFSLPPRDFTPVHECACDLITIHQADHFHGCCILFFFV